MVKKFTCEYCVKKISKDCSSGRESLYRNLKKPFKFRNVFRDASHIHHENEPHLHFVRKKNWKYTFE